MKEGPNNFELLLEQQTKAIQPELQQRTEEGLFKTFESLRLVGQLFDVFVPKMVDVLVVAAGGDGGNDGAAAYNSNVAQFPLTPTEQKGPALPEGGSDEIR